MAIIKCPECNKEISDTAKTCIHCGYKIKGIKLYLLFVLWSTDFTKSTN